MYTNFPWEIKYSGRFDPVTILWVRAGVEMINLLSRCADPSEKGN